ncbi:MAG: creatininase family protein [Chloroflexota bacterium]|nr:creatininase family protein [Chloroflexota bacterium]
MKPLKEVLWSEHTRDEFSDWAERGTVVVVPIASTEQHGHHLPVDTDCRTVEYVAAEAARSLDDVPVLVTRVIPFGVSPHHMVHNGTITLRVVTVINMLREICESIAAQGFERILILSGHGGNDNTIRAAALELKHTLNMQIEACCWFGPVQEKIDAICEGPCHTIGHAGEAETSAILALAPESVHEEKYELVKNISDAYSASADKGERILRAGAEAVAELLRDMAARPGKKVVGIQQAK